MIQIFPGYDIYAVLGNPFFLLFLAIVVFAIGYYFFKKRILLSLLKGFLAIAIAFYSSTIIGSIITANFGSIIAAKFLWATLLISALFPISYFYLTGCSWKISVLLGVFSSFFWLGLMFSYSIVFLRMIPHVYEMLFGVKPSDLDLNYQGLILGIGITGVICTTILHKYCSKVTKKLDSAKNMLGFQNQQ